MIRNKLNSVTLEAIIVCHNYGDFLEHTLPNNLPYFNRLVVVTHYDDKRTIAVCKKYGVDVVKTGVMHENGDKFNKGRCINLGLGHCVGTDWLLHLDADILLPHDFRRVLQRAHLQRENIYGADRVNVLGFDAYLGLKDHLRIHYSDGYFVEAPRGHPVGARIVHLEHGYTPIGYFQLWHSSMGRKYPIHQGNAEHTDVLFGVQWTRKNRVLLPDCYVYHLDSETDQVMGINWGGRRTRPFGPCHPHHHKPPYKPCK